MNTVNQALLARLKHNREALLDQDGRVRIDLACRTCGYNLRGASGDGGCPECGHPVEDALQDDRPEHSNPRWLARVALGGNLFGIAALVAIGLLLLLIATAIVSDISRHRQLAHLLVVADVVLVVATAGLATAACWLITLRDPTRHHHTYENRCRWVARIGLIAAFPVAVLIGQVIAPLLTGYYAISPVLGYLTLAFPLVLFTAGLIALLLYVQTLAARMTDWNLVQSITTVCYGHGACATLYLIGALFIQKLGPPVLACGCCNTFVAAALGVWTVLLFECIRQDLNAAKQRADWGRE